MHMRFTRNNSIRHPCEQFNSSHSNAVQCFCLQSMSLFAVHSFVVSYKGLHSFFFWGFQKFFQQICVKSQSPISMCSLCLFSCCHIVGCCMFHTCGHKIIHFGFLHGITNISHVWKTFIPMLCVRVYEHGAHMTAKLLSWFQRATTCVRMQNFNTFLR